MNATERLLAELLANDASDGTESENGEYDDYDGWDEADDDADFEQVGFHDLNRRPTGQEDLDD